MILLRLEPCSLFGDGEFTLADDTSAQGRGLARSEVEGESAGLGNWGLLVRAVWTLGCFRRSPCLGTTGAT